MNLLSWIWVPALPIALLWSLPFFSDFLGLPFVLRSVLRRRVHKAGPAVQRLLFLVPAHNEALLIQGNVRSFRAMGSKGNISDICVIADNCTDDTAQLAREAGARVLERHDLEQRGKPHAVRWAMDQHDLSTYDALIVIDADAVVDPGFAEALVAVGELRNQAVQTYNGIRNQDESWLTRLAYFLTSIRYEGQYVYKRLSGINCPITGNGMCVGTNLLRDAGWPSVSLAEDSEVYVRYTLYGATIEYEPRARSFSQEAHTMEESGAQRRRWQAGRWTVAKTYARQIVTSTTIGFRQKLEIFADLVGVGPVLHAGVAALAIALLVLAGNTPALVVAGLFACAMLPLAIWAVIFWIRSDAKWKLIAALGILPVYAIWRMGIAIRALDTGRRMVWERSPRH